ncbi:hypothetical protein [Mesorhizobium sp.]|uniref:hypothetical protein n=1 Tax=Mesorhizobium sp. TaxID=1871066 RepID=UPI000FE88C61|nr:hypothetical protein [Mesorhizobium sp.]RWD31159.1 MAG: hypothetical protein EOS33_14655 [Mesorhizobium sp.]
MTTENDSTANVVHILSDRDSKGRFAVGKAKGRPVGAVARVSRDLLKQVKALGPRAIDKLTEALDANQEWAIKLILQHCLPKGRAVEFEDMTVDDLLAAAKSSDISLEEFRTAVDAMAKVHDIQELDQLRERIDQLEAMLNGKAHSRA